MPQLQIGVAAILKRNAVLVICLAIATIRIDNKYQIQNVQFKNTKYKNAKYKIQINFEGERIWKCTVDKSLINETSVTLKRSLDMSQILYSVFFKANQSNYKYWDGDAVFRNSDLVIVIRRIDTGNRMILQAAISKTFTIVTIKTFDCIHSLPLHCKALIQSRQIANLLRGWTPIMTS